MPTYKCSLLGLNIGAEKKYKLANAVTASHCECIGDPPQAVQVIFDDLPPGQCFVGGSLADGRILVTGLVSPQAANDQNQLLSNRLLELFTEICGVQKTSVWIYLQELQRDSIIECGNGSSATDFGQEWIGRLPENLMKYSKFLAQRKINS